MVSWVGLAYAGPEAMWARQRWSNYRSFASAEEGMAKVQAGLASEADNRAAQLRLKGRMSEAEQLAKRAERHRQSESLHLKRSQETSPTLVVILPPLIPAPADCRQRPRSLRKRSL